MDHQDDIDEPTNEDNENTKCKDPPEADNEEDPSPVIVAVVAGVVVGGGVGATIGALAIGIPTFGIGAGLGLALGGAIGAGVGGTVSGVGAKVAMKKNIFKWIIKRSNKVLNCYCVNLLCHIICFGHARHAPPPAYVVYTRLIYQLGWWIMLA